MAFFIYNIATTEILLARARSVGCYIRSYKTEGAAKAALTRMDKKGKLGGRYQGADFVKADFAISEATEFQTNIEKTHMVRSAMNGAMVEESVNTPYSSSVASENYWCS